MWLQDCLSNLVQPTCCSGISGCIILARGFSTPFSARTYMRKGGREGAKGALCVTQGQSVKEQRREKVCECKRGRADKSEGRGIGNNLQLDFPDILVVCLLSSWVLWSCL